jgi:hypothetical protein
VKPAYEIVRADELQPDDVIVLDIHSHGVHVDRLIKGGGLVTVYPSKDVLSHKQPVLRQLPPERNPDVLMRTIEIMHEHGNLRWDVSEWIEIAREKLESEAGDEQD